MPVLSEDATWVEARSGTSIARFGHGEIAILNGKDAALQRYDKWLREELWWVAESEGKRGWPKDKWRVCMPPVRGKNAWHWNMFLNAWGKKIDPVRQYGSSLITRRDEIEWSKTALECATYFGQFTPLRGPERNAYDAIDEMEEKAMKMEDPICISAGPAATVLALRLKMKGRWALDLGNMWSFL